MKSISTVFFNGTKLLYVNRLPLLRILAIPFCVLVITEYLELIEEERFDLLSTCLDFIAYCYVAILTHRVMILGPDSVPRYGLYNPTMRELVFAAHFFGLAVIATPCIILLFLIPQSTNLLFLLSAVGFLYIFCRISLVFPAIATGKSWSYNDSWKATKDFQGIAIVTVGIFPVLISSLELVVNQFDNQFLMAIYSGLSTVVIVAILSSTYQHITNEHPT